MFRNHTGTSTLEWVVVAAIIIAVVGGALYLLGQTINDKIREINVQVGG